MDVVWSVESQGAEVGGDDDQVDGETQTDEENHGDQGTVSQDYGVFIKPPHVPHPAVEQCEVVSEAGEGEGEGRGAGYVSLGKHVVCSVTSNQIKTAWC